eukprot:3911021-Pyramimonas_sp.AAC.1
MYLETQRVDQPQFRVAPMELYEKPFDPTTLRGWIVADTPSNLRVPTLAPTAEAQHASLFMMQEEHQAGAPADGSDGSWMQAQRAD